MSALAQWKIISWIVVALLLVSIFERLNISVERVLICSIVIGLLCIIFLPKFFVNYLSGLISLSKKKEKSVGVWGMAGRVGLVLFIKRLHEAIWGKGRN